MVERKSPRRRERGAVSRSALSQWLLLVIGFSVILGPAVLRLGGCWEPSEGEVIGGEASSSAPHAEAPAPRTYRTPVAGADRVLPGGDFLLGGIQVNEADHEHWVQTLEARGFNTVSVTVYAHQGDWNSSNLWFDDEAPAVVSEIRAAREEGLEVVLILRVALDHAFDANRFFWHGMIQPRTEPELEEWFRRYRLFALRWAAIAEREGVDLLGIGSELNALTSTVPVDGVPALEDYFLSSQKAEERREDVLRFADRLEEGHLGIAGGASYDTPRQRIDAEIEAQRRWAGEVVGAEDREPPPDAEAVAAINHRRQILEENWRALIADLRQVYSGPMTYAANFDQYHEVGFWDALDWMGINAYFQLRKVWQPQLPEARLAAQLEAGWQEVLATIDDQRRLRGVPQMPVIFTELGYTRGDGCTLEPWASTGFSILPASAVLPGGSAAQPEKAPTVKEEGAKELVIWTEQPERREERALAIAGLRRAAARQPGLLRGLLWWKLSTVPSHEEIEPFVLRIDDGSEDPLLDPLAALRSLGASSGVSPRASSGVSPGTSPGEPGAL
ncbi:MAG: hypothetical protein AAGD01_15515 [Acidobacteriota bacterium]